MSRKEELERELKRELDSPKGTCKRMNEIEGQLEKLSQIQTVWLGGGNLHYLAVFYGLPSLN